MLTLHCLRQTSRYLIIKTSRTASTAINSKQTENVTGSTNYPSFHETKTIDSNRFNDLKTNNVESVKLNDLIEAKRVENEKSTDQTPIITSSEKFSTGLSPLPTTSSMTPTGAGLFHDAKLSNTPISPGIPITPNVSPITKEERPRKDEQVPSSGFSAFLRGIRSGLPFFPSKDSKSSPINITTTRESFIPLTRPSLIRLIATDSQLIDDEDERLLFHELCQGFDSAIIQRYRPILNELKDLFNPLNPDNETITNRRISYRDRLDNEYWLLQKINDLLTRANFTELPRDILVDKFIQHKDSSLSSNLNIQIDGYDYDVLKFWILGREQMPIEQQPWWKKFLKRIDQSTSRDYFKRVVLAVRLKGQDRLYLKAFRDISLQNITQLLPVGKLQIGNFEQKLIRSTILLGAGTFATHLITTMANYPLSELVIGGSCLTLILSLYSLRSYYLSKINYLSSMNRLLFYKNVASNKQLLAMIVDRAEDELSKEVLLVYMFIQSKQKQNVDLTTKSLELEIENWIHSKANVNVTFKSDQSIECLRKLGIILPNDSSGPDCLQVLPFKQVIGILPKVSRILSEKHEEWDLIEGYDKKYFEIDWKTVLNEDKILNKGGWH